MRAIIRNQIHKCEIADTSSAVKTADGIFLHIPKYTKPQYIKNRYYIIKICNLADLATIRALNNEKCPASMCLKIYVTNVKGKYITVDSIGYDLNAYRELFNVWSGILPTDCFELITTL